MKIFCCLKQTVSVFMCVIYFNFFTHSHRRLCGAATDRAKRKRKKNYIEIYDYLLTFVRPSVSFLSLFAVASALVTVRLPENSLSLGAIYLFFFSHSLLSYFYAIAVATLRHFHPMCISQPCNATFVRPWNFFTAKSTANGNEIEDETNTNTQGKSLGKGDNMYINRYGSKRVCSSFAQISYY